MKQDIQPQSVEAFLDLVGRKTFQDETGYSAQRVSRAKGDRVFPTQWLWKVREFCERRKLATPEHLFRGHPNAPNAADATAA